MAKFMIAYHGGDKPNSKEEGMAHMSKWKAWADSLGEAVINPGTPLLGSKIVTLSNVEEDKNPNSMNGFLIIEAESIEAAIEMAKLDPFLTINGTLRISEMMEIK